MTWEDFKTEIDAKIASIPNHDGAPVVIEQIDVHVTRGYLNVHLDELDGRKLQVWNR